MFFGFFGRSVFWGMGLPVLLGFVLGLALRGEIKTTSCFPIETPHILGGVAR